MTNAEEIFLKNTSTQPSAKVLKEMLEKIFFHLIKKHFAKSAALNKLLKKNILE